MTSQMSIDDERLLAVADAQARARANRNMPIASRLLYECLVDGWPALLDGEQVEIQLSQLREKAGWVSERVTTSFFRSLVEIHALEYDSGRYNQTGNKRIGIAIPNAEIFPFPEYFDLRQTKDAKKARESAREKQRELKAALLPVECPQCGNAHLLYDITAKCPDCGHMQEPYVGIPSRLITVDDEASLDDVFDGLLPEEGE